jgi:hypothetical protein
VYLITVYFWTFDKLPPKFISRVTPVSDQFDTSAPGKNNIETSIEKK